MNPTINVNLRKCPCPALHGRTREEFIHGAQGCPAAPVLIPCPIPRSVTFTVQIAPISECIFPCTWTSAFHQGPHHEKCPCRPLRVSCSISGETWEESEVDWQTRNERGDWNPSPMSYAERGVALALCRERWALVKTLVLGRPFIPNHWGGPASVMDLFTRRDAVFAALADMARAEEQAWQAAKRLLGAVPRVMVSDAMRVPKPSDPERIAASESWLAAYAEHLIEQVGVLP